MTTTLCRARYRHNRFATCGKPLGHLTTDPLHKLDPDDAASMEWFDYDTERLSVPDLLGSLQRAVDAARRERAEAGEHRG